MRYMEADYPNYIYRFRSKCKRADKLLDAFMENEGTIDFDDIVEEYRQAIEDVKIAKVQI